MLNKKLSVHKSMTWHKEGCLIIITLLFIWQLMLQVSVLLAGLATYMYLTDGLNLIGIGKNFVSGSEYSLILFGKFAANDYSVRLSH